MLFPNGKPTAPPVSSPFGRRPNVGAFSFHYGVDLIGFTWIGAVAPGVVTFAGWMNPAAGNTIVIDHGHGISSVYMHNSTHLVNRGDRVFEGQNIATMGATGNATGRCCHLEIRIQGTSVDPIPYINERLTTGATAGGGAQTPQEEEDDMFTDEDRTALNQVRDVLGARGGLDTKTADSVAFLVRGMSPRVQDVQLALTNALPVLLKQSTGGNPKEVAAAVVAAIPDDLAQDIIDGLAERLTRK